MEREILLFGRKKRYKKSEKTELRYQLLLSWAFSIFLWASLEARRVVLTSQAIKRVALTGQRLSFRRGRGGGEYAKEEEQDDHKP